MRFPSLLICLGASTFALAAHAQMTQEAAPPGGAPAPDQTTMPPTDTAPSPAPESNMPDTGAAPMPAPQDNAPPAPGPTPPNPAPEGSMTPPPPPSAYNATPGAPAPGGVQMAPPQPMVQAAPEPPANYPLCSRTVKDSCRNPKG